MIRRSIIDAADRLATGAVAWWYTRSRPSTFTEFRGANGRKFISVSAILLVWRLEADNRENSFPATFNCEMTKHIPSIVCIAKSCGFGDSANGAIKLVFGCQLGAAPTVVIGDGEVGALGDRDNGNGLPSPRAEKGEVPKSMQGAESTWRGTPDAALLKDSADCDDSPVLLLMVALPIRMWSRWQ